MDSVEAFEFVGWAVPEGRRGQLRARSAFERKNDELDETRKRSRCVPFLESSSRGFRVENSFEVTHPVEEEERDVRRSARSSRRVEGSKGTSGRDATHQFQQDEGGPGRLFSGEAYGSQKSS